MIENGLFKLLLRGSSAVTQIESWYEQLLSLPTGRNVEVTGVGIPFSKLSNSCSLSRHRPLEGGKAQAPPLEGGLHARLSLGKRPVLLLPVKAEDDLPSH